MSTVTKEIADDVIAENGRYRGDPQVYKVYKYTDAWGGENYKLVYQRLNALLASHYVINPQLYWEYQPSGVHETIGEFGAASTLEDHLK
jgi:hypothetical protein